MSAALLIHCLPESFSSFISHFLPKSNGSWPSSPAFPCSSSTYTHATGSLRKACLHKALASFPASQLPSVLTRLCASHSRTCLSRITTLHLLVSAQGGVSVCHGEDSTMPGRHLHPSCPSPIKSHRRHTCFPARSQNQPDERICSDGKSELTSNSNTKVHIHHLPPKCALLALTWLSSPFLSWLFSWHHCPYCSSSPVFLGWQTLGIRSGLDGANLPVASLGRGFTDCTHESQEEGVKRCGLQVPGRDTTWSTLASPRPSLPKM